MKIALFHYHLKPGGVTDVIVFSTRILLKHLDEISEIRLVTGDKNGCQLVMDRIRSGLERNLADKLKLDVLEELAYSDEKGIPDVTNLEMRLEARYGEDTLWWVHNYHIGKNPSFTAVLMNIARASNRDILLHIHDFPECGRPDNFRRNNEVLKAPAYPSGSRIRYALINERDRRILADSGLGDAASLLRNPVPEPKQGSHDSAKLKAALEEKCAVMNPGFIPGAPILLYPVRCIRRKNVLEAALLAHLLDNPANLIVTLPGVSAQEKKYSQLVESAYNEGFIPGIWCPEASGDERLNYANLAASCDGIISTSVQEGFGYLFINALYWQKPLLARYLDTLDGILEIFGDYPRRFWANFRVPADAKLSDKTRESYLRKISTMENIIPEKSLKSIRAAAEKIASGGGIDFSYLAVEDQMDCLKKVKDKGLWLDETRSLNRELLDSMDRTLLAKAPDMRSIISRQFSESSYIQAFSQILSSFGRKMSSPSATKIQESVSKAFGRIDYLRLLYDY